MYGPEIPNPNPKTHSKSSNPNRETQSKKIQNKSKANTKPNSLLQSIPGPKRLQPLPHSWLPLPPAVLRAFATAASMCEFQRRRGSGLIRVTTSCVELRGRVAVAPGRLTRWQWGAGRALERKRERRHYQIVCHTSIERMSILSRSNNPNFPPVLRSIDCLTLLHRPKLAQVPSCRDLDPI